MWNDIELLTSDDTGSGYLSVGSRKEHGTALYQVDLLAKISSEKVMILMPFLFIQFLLCFVGPGATWYFVNECSTSQVIKVQSQIIGNFHLNSPYIILRFVFPKLNLYRWGRKK